MKIGDTLYKKNYGRNATKELIPVIVRKLGRKYIYVSEEGHEEEWALYNYHIDSLLEVTEYAATSKLYLSTESYDDEVESGILNNQLTEIFKYGNSHLPLVTLRKIKQLIDNK